MSRVFYIFCKKEDRGTVLTVEMTEEPSLLSIPLKK